MKSNIEKFWWNLIPRTTSEQLVLIIKDSIELEKIYLEHIVKLIGFTMYFSII